MSKFFIITSTLTTLLSTIYNYSFTDINGNVVNMSAFEGKKILIVNTSSDSERVNQYAELETLYQAYKDSLVIIAFPSNSFGNEPSEDSAIQSFVTDNYGIHYLLASKISVAGENQHPLYQWLTKDSLNNVVSTPVQTDFYKFLINEQGSLMGVYTAEVSPMDTTLRRAIEERMSTEQ